MNDTIMAEQDVFKPIFKYFKQRFPLPDYSLVKGCEDFVRADRNKVCSLDKDISEKAIKLGVVPPNSWHIHTVENHPGLWIISNPFTVVGSAYWIKRCIQEFSGRNHQTNITPDRLPPGRWWSDARKDLSRNVFSKKVKMLHWATMGYHHNWDTKEYSTDMCSKMPTNVEDLCRLFLSIVTDYPCDSYRAEAAIVNYYEPKSTLAPHTDHSEPFLEAPLVSFSFGQSAVFLIGGPTKSTKPTPIFLHHGDVMIMSRESRICLHAVPKILSEKDVYHWGGTEAVQKQSSYWHAFSQQWMQEHHDDKDDIIAMVNYIKSSRINFNVRQVMEPNI